MGRRDIDHVVRALEIRGIWCGEVTATDKGSDAIEGRRIFIATIREIAEKVDPQRIDAITLSVGHVCGSFRLREIGDQGLRCVTDY